MATTDAHTNTYCPQDPIDADIPDIASLPDEPEHPCIIILHASVGSGHRSAAIALQQAFCDLRDTRASVFPDGSPLPADTDIEVIDLLSWGRIHFDGNKMASSFTGVTRPLYDITWRYTFTGRVLYAGGCSWSMIMYPKFTAYVRKRKPLAIVATHIVGANCGTGARINSRQDYPLIFVPTDYETEGFWPHRYADAFCIGTESMAETLRARKVPESAIRITGIPTRQDFTRTYEKSLCRKHFNLPEDKQVIVGLIGAKLPQPYLHLRERIDEVLPYMHRFSHTHLVLVCGSDETYANHVRKIVAEHALSNVTVYEYVHDVAELMSASDVAICKSGGLTVTECLCTATPMILVGKSYGQEKINTRFLTENGAAIHVTTSRELLAALVRFEKNPDHLRSMVENSKFLRRPNAACDIAKITCELIKTPSEKRASSRKKSFFRIYLGYSPAHER